MSRSIKARVREATNRLIAPLGLHLARTERVFEMGGLLMRASARDPKIATWIDVGASDGSWSLLARRRFPNARFLLFEPLAERQSRLAVLEERLGFLTIAAVAGASPGMVEFVVDPALDGSAVAGTGFSGASRQVPMETINRAVAERNLPGPFGIKLDTHGYELPVLEGAARILASTELLIIEAYNFQLTPNCLRFHELCAWLEARGFRCCDLADPMRRPSDGALWQMDLAFAPASSALFSSNCYR